jgi:hypothetical protein
MRKHATEMRLPEKTIELNFCTQLERAIGRPLLWFGLTQKQEAMAGFDAATRIGGRLLLFQIKSSNHTVFHGARRFRAQHHQLTALQHRTGSARRAVFYVLPMVGTTLELASRPNLLSATWFLDVSSLPKPFPAPTIRGGSRLRSSGIHYIDVAPPQARIHSDPVEVEILSIVDFLERGLPGSDGIGWAFDNSPGVFEETRRLFTGAAVGVVIR